MKYLKIGSNEWTDAAIENQKQRDENRSSFFSKQNQEPVGFDKINLPYAERFNHFNKIYKKGSENRIEDSSLNEVMSLAFISITQHNLSSPKLLNTLYEGKSTFSLKQYTMLSMAAYFDDDNVSFAHLLLKGK